MTIFKGFGDSTLDFELRVFIAQRDLYVDVMNRINGAIAREFEKSSIEISFPQLDLHVKGNESLAELAPAVIRVDAGHESTVAPRVEANRPSRQLRSAAVR